MALAAALVMLSLAAPSVLAQYGYGTSTVSFANSSVSIMQGGTANVTFTITLATGSTWGTTASITDSAQLSSEGIAASAKPSYGDPTYSGTVSISVSSSTAPGTYNITLAATGDDPSASPASLAVIVAQRPTANTTSASAGSTSIANKTSVSTKPVSVSTLSTSGSGVAPGYGSSPGTPDYAAYDVVALVIVVIAIVAAFAAFRKR